MSEQRVDSTVRKHRRILPFGAQLIGDDRTRFRLWAPSCEQVALEVEGAAPLPMQAQPGGWFEVEAPCTAGARYFYRVAPDLRVPDPAARFQPDDVHGPSQVIDPFEYVWRNTEWHGRRWEETVLYEMHVGAMGGYRGVREHLPRLAEMGITAIELMPLNDFPGARNWGYDGVLPFAPDSAYGEPDDLKALIDEAHGLGLMVFLDVVYNHFGPDGNFLHAYAEPFFKANEPTPWGPAINFDAPEVRDFFFENALYWLMEYRFDGLRLDAVHAIHNDSWLRELSERVRSTVEHGRHVHLVLENEHNTSSLLDGHFDAQWSDDAHNTLHVLLTGESESYYAAFAERPMHKLARLLSEGFVYQGEPSPIHDNKPRGEPSAELPPSAFVMFLQNHDQVGNRALGERITRLAEPAALRAAYALLLLSPQIPMLFMGEEWGSSQPFLFFTGYRGELADAVREGRRKEFAKFAAFNDASGRSKIPDPNDVQTFIDSCPRPDWQDPEARQWLDLTQTLLRIRCREIMPRIHGARSLGAQLAGGDTAKALVARWRLGDGSILSIALNLGAEPAARPVGDDSFDFLPEGSVLFESGAGVMERVSSGEIPPYSCAVLRAPGDSTQAAADRSMANATLPGADTRTPGIGCAPTEGGVTNASAETAISPPDANRRAPPGESR